MALYPTTSATLLSKLKHTGDSHAWEISWKRFVELYHEPLKTVARGIYHNHTGGQTPSPNFIDDAIADVIADFFSKGHHHYDPGKGRLRGYLRVAVNARIVDRLRRERPIDSKPLPDDHDLIPEETESERESFHHALLATMIEDLRNRIPMRLFEVFERVKLKHQNPASVAEELGITRANVDRSIYKAMQALRELARREEYREEFAD